MLIKNKNNVWKKLLEKSNICNRNFLKTCFFRFYIVWHIYLQTFSLCFRPWGEIYHTSLKHCIRRLSLLWNLRHSSCPRIFHGPGLALGTNRRVLFFILLLTNIPTVPLCVTLFAPHLSWFTAQAEILAALCHKEIKTSLSCQCLQI